MGGDHSVQHDYEGVDPVCRRVGCLERCTWRGSVSCSLGISRCDADVIQRRGLHRQAAHTGDAAVSHHAPFGRVTTCANMHQFFQC